MYNGVINICNSYNKYLSILYLKGINCRRLVPFIVLIMYNKWDIAWKHTIIKRVTETYPYKYSTVCNDCWVNNNNKRYNAMNSCKQCKGRTRKTIDNWEYLELQLTWWEYTKINKDDYEKIRNYCWYKSARWNVESRIWKRLVKLHRLLMNPPIGMVVDHINWNQLDNRKNNLRICTTQQNNLNKTSSRNSRTWIKNIYFYPNKDKYLVQCTFKWKIIWTKWFRSLEEAKEYRDVLLIQTHWKYARI